MGQCLSLKQRELWDEEPQFSEEENCDQDKIKALCSSGAEAARTKELYLTGIKAGAASLKLKDKLVLAQALSGGREDWPARSGPEHSARPARSSQKASAQVNSVHVEAFASVPANRPASISSLLLIQAQPNSPTSPPPTYIRAVSGSGTLQGTAYDNLRRINSIGGSASGPIRGGGSGGGATVGGSRRAAAEDAAAVVSMTKLLQCGGLGTPGPRAPSLPAHQHHRFSVTPTSLSSGGAVCTTPLAQVSRALSQDGASDGAPEHLTSGGLMQLAAGVRPSLDGKPLAEALPQEAFESGSRSSLLPHHLRPRQQNYFSATTSPTPCEGPGLSAQMMASAWHHPANSIGGAGAASGPVADYGGGGGVGNGSGGGGNGGGNGWGFSQTSSRLLVCRNEATKEMVAVHRFLSETIDSNAAGGGLLDVATAGSVGAAADGDGDGDGSAAAQPALFPSGSNAGPAPSGGSLAVAPTTPRKFLPRWNSQTRPSVRLAAQPKRPALKPGTTGPGRTSLQPFQSPPTDPRDASPSPPGREPSAPIAGLDWGLTPECPRDVASEVLVPVMTRGSGNLAVTRGSGNLAVARGSGNLAMTRGSGNLAMTRGSGNLALTHGSGNLCAFAATAEPMTAPGCARDLVTPFSSDLTAPPSMLAHQRLPLQMHMHLHMQPRPVGGGHTLGAQPPMLSLAAVNGGSGSGRVSGSGRCSGSGSGCGGVEPLRSCRTRATAMRVVVPEILVITPMDSPCPSYSCAPRSSTPATASPNCSTRYTGEPPAAASAAAASSAMEALMASAGASAGAYGAECGAAGNCESGALAASGRRE